MQFIETILGLISALVLAKNGQNTPKLCTVALVISTQQLGGPLWAMLGPIRRPNSKILAIMETISPFFAHKKGLVHI